MEQKNLVQDNNLKGWESIAGKWRYVKWPRRPIWHGEFSRVAPLLDDCRGKEVLVLGATPEFRAWMGSRGASVVLYEKSIASLEAMNSILKEDFCFEPKNEKVINADWEDDACDKKKFSLVMGDIVLGYMETKERMIAFLRKVVSLLADNGKFVLRDFVKNPYVADNYKKMPIDLRRWAYIMTPGMAIEGNIFDEELLAWNLQKIGDFEALSTCANPPRKRFIPDFNQLVEAFQKVGFREFIVIPPSTELPKPGLFVLSKK